MPAGAYRRAKGLVGTKCPPVGRRKPIDGIRYVSPDGLIVGDLLGGNSHYENQILIVGVGGPRSPAFFRPAKRLLLVVQLLPAQPSYDVGEAYILGEPLLKILFTLDRLFDGILKDPGEVEGRPPPLDLTIYAIRHRESNLMSHVYASEARVI